MMLSLNGLLLRKHTHTHTHTHAHLFPDVEKTKARICLGHRHSQSFSSAAAYKRLYDMSLPSHISRKRRKVNCSHCYIALNEQYMPTHIRHIHHMTFYSSMNVDQTDSAPPPYINVTVFNTFPVPMRSTFLTKS
jgi:hypothetical protein